MQAVSEKFKRTLHSRIVSLPVNNELLEDFEKYKHLLGGHEVGRHPSDTPGITLIRMAMPDAPDGADSMNATFTKHADGTISLLGIDYYAADGSRIT